MLEVLTRLYTGELRHLVLAAAALWLAVGVATAWAVCSRRHWFLRIAVVGAALSPALLIPGYDVVLIFFVQAVVGASFLTWVKSLRLRKAERLGREDGTESTSRRARFQFTLADLMLATLVISVVLGVASCVPKDVWAEWKWIGLLGVACGVHSAWLPEVVLLLSGRERLGSMPANRRCGKRRKAIVISETVLVALILFVNCSVMICPGISVFHVVIHPAPLAPVTLPDPNGYDDLIRAGARVTAIGVPDAKSATAAELRKFLAGSAEALEVARRGLDRECQVPLTYTLADIGSKNSQTLRDLGRAFLAEGKLAEQEGRTSDAVESYLDALRLADAVPRGGVATDALVGWGVAGMARDALASIRQTMDDQQCRRAIEALAEFDAGQEPVEDLLAREVLWDEHFFGKEGRAITVMKGAGLFGVPVWIRETLMRGVKRNQAETRLLICELALCRYRLARGSGPKELVELVPDWLPAVPIDPYSGVPLVYRPTSSGHQLYSVGPDGVDDGGRPMREDSRAEIEPGDILVPELAEQEEG